MQAARERQEGAAAALECFAIFFFASTTSGRLAMKVRHRRSRSRRMGIISSKCAPHGHLAHQREHVFAGPIAGVQVHQQDRNERHVKVGEDTFTTAADRDDQNCQTI